MNKISRGFLTDDESTFISVIPDINKKSINLNVNSYQKGIIMDFGGFISLTKPQWKWVIQNINKHLKETKNE